MITTTTAIKYYVKNQLCKKENENDNQFSQFPFLDDALKMVTNAATTKKKIKLEDNERVVFQKVIQFMKKQRKRVYRVYVVQSHR